VLECFLVLNLSRHTQNLRYISQVLFNAVLENACSEQGARMSAMDSSSRNAGEMLDRLTLTYNRSIPLSLLSQSSVLYVLQNLWAGDMLPGSCG